jgi:F0F1-type ATP synthase gamma subunit
MPRVAELREEIKNTQTLKTIADALSEVSSTKIVAIRKSFETNKDFYREISELYETVRTAADVAAALTRKGPRTTPQLRQARATKRSVSTPAAARAMSAAVTTNQRFYGLINLEVSERFKEETEKSGTKRIMIGRTGAKYLEALGDTAPVEHLNFERDIPSTKEINTFLKLVEPYDKVIVYYPQFINMFTQVPAKVDITYSPTTDKITERQPLEELQFIFEPELPKIRQFFETHIRYLLFKRVMLDVELALTASRLLSMSRAAERAGETLTRRRRVLAKQKRALINARLLEATMGALGANKGW